MKLFSPRLTLSLIVILTTPLCIANCSLSQQKKKKVNYQRFVSIVIPQCKRLHDSAVVLGKALAETGEAFGSVYDSKGEAEAFKRADEMCKKANMILSDSSLYRFSMRESLAQFGGDSLLDSTLANLERAQAALDAFAENALKTRKKANLLVNRPNSSDMGDMVRLKAARDICEELLLHYLVWVEDDCAWLVSNRNLHDDLSYLDPVTIAEQKGKPRPYHQFKKGLDSH